ncbi:Zinc finger protein [Plakobranchus ocellatus]|uniref:Zinc finger protein n=1 Tax=Plakobranchus ocellatus TaxID=259542 RepID=A0AAV4BIU3_9GAST|nr:Zinc finger protein [Plakobranchus ocellatus]
MVNQFNEPFYKNPVKCFDAMHRMRKSLRPETSPKQFVALYLDENVEKVRNAPRPKSKREVRAFLGLVGYYKEFIANFAAVSAPLSDLVRKGQPNVVNWGDSQERAYNSLKVAVTSKPVLQLPDVNKRFVLRTDASDRGLGAALMQENEGTLFPVAYASKKLTDRERKYSVTEREALAIVWGVKMFSLYLYGAVFTLQTDHGALQFLNAAKFDSPRIMRWALALQPLQCQENTRESLEVGSRNYRDYDEATLLKAIDECKKCPVKDVAQIYKIPIRTLRNKIKGAHNKSPGRPTALIRDFEDMIAKHLLSCSDYGMPLDKDDIRYMVKAALDKAIINVKNVTNNMPGIDWVRDKKTI